MIDINVCPLVLLGNANLKINMYRHLHQMKSCCPQLAIERSKNHFILIDKIITIQYYSLYIQIYN